ncbi:MAG: hypothetical protein K2M65_01060 [Muribaculaceae bacterium]|nr:hypothetical protein [Muribaculaceae bacterium]
MTECDASSQISEQPCELVQDRLRLSLGLPAAVDKERRFPLTPECVAILVNNGLLVHIEEGASAPIHYSDQAYINAGAEVLTRNEVLRSDIVLSLSALSSTDLCKVRKGAMLFTLMQSVLDNVGLIRGLLERAIVCVALDRVRDEDGKTPFADILQEIDGRAAVTLAAAMQADPDHGKGILMGGVAGIVPCEVTIFGSGIAACAAAKSAAGLGATVRLFDNDIYSLRKAVRYLGDGVISSALHPHVLEGALRSADVVVATPMKSVPEIDKEMIDYLKKRVLLFDLNDVVGRVFPSINGVNLGASDGQAGGRDRYYYNVGACVPRTAAMAIGNAFVTLIDQLLGLGDAVVVRNTLKFLPGLQPAVVTFMGKPIDRAVAAVVGQRSVDLSLFLSLS